MSQIGKLMQQAQKMQQQMQELQASLAARVIEVSSGGGAVVVKVNGNGEFLSLTISPELLKEDAALVSSTVLSAIRDAAAQAKTAGEAQMRKLTAGLSLPGLGG